jgi:hypothetical protein
MLLTPTYHVFHMYKPFRGATHLPVELEAPQHKLGETSAPTLTVSAARGADGKLHIALVNLNPREAVSGTIRIPGATLKKVSGTILTATAMDAHNTFDKPETVKPAAFKGARVQQGLVHVEVPAKSIIVLSETPDELRIPLKLKPGTAERVQAPSRRDLPELRSCCVKPAFTIIRSSSTRKTCTCSRCSRFATTTSANSAQPPSHGHWWVYMDLMWHPADGRPTVAA